MNYEEKYKAALEMAEKVKQNYNLKSLHRVIDIIFPELKESEDERIRKEIISALKFANHKGLYDRHIAWLEKQESVKEIVERCKTSWYNEGKIAGMAEGLTDDEKYQQGWHDALEKQGEQKPVISDDALKEGIAHFGITQYQIDNWLKKYIIGVEKQCKPANKVGLKFKVGDWIIRSAEAFKYNTYHIKEVKDYYVCEDLKGRRVPFTFDDVHKNFKLWDIADAKDGDVLTVNGRPFIYCCFEDYQGNYCCIDSNGEFRTSFDFGFNGKTILPATKEQRDTLFAEMREAGYEWDAEEKELKKI